MLKIAMKVGWEVTSRCQLSDRKQIRTANIIQAKMRSILPGKNFEKRIVTKNILNLFFVLGGYGKKRDIFLSQLEKMLH